MHVAPEHLGAAQHVIESYARGLPAGVKAFAVVLHHYLRDSVRLRNADPHLRGIGMFDDVGELFLQDAVDSQLAVFFKRGVIIVVFKNYPEPGRSR